LGITDYGTDDLWVQAVDASAFLSETGDEIDRSTFEQILEMDDDENEREFSRSIVFDFFDQAEGTFKKMDSYV
jgi:osomolarity two-component system phosphorelay intermediate protein YPD1